MSHTHHHHSHGHFSSPGGQGRPYMLGIALGGAFVIAELIWSLKAHSLSLMADAGHNAGDVLALVMAWCALRLGRKKPSPRFTYGLQSASIFAALANALLLVFTVGGIGWEAFQRFMAPELPATGTVMIVALIGIAINGVSAFFFHEADQHDLNTRSAFVHLAGDAVISLGVAISALVIRYTGWLWFDPLVSLLIAGSIVTTSWRLLRDAVRLALHAVPSEIDPAGVKHVLGALDGVAAVHDLHIWAMSTTGVALSAHLAMPGGHPGDSFLRDTAAMLAHRFHIGHATLQIEIGDEQCIGCEQRPSRHPEHSEESSATG